MVYSLKLVNAVLRLCSQDRVGGVDNPDSLPQRARKVVDAYDEAYDAFLMDARPLEARCRQTISASAVTDIQTGDWLFTQRHALPADALGLAEDPSCLDFEMALDLVGGQERRVLRSNYEGALNVVYLRRVDPDALSPVAFRGASLALAAVVAFDLTQDYEIAGRRSKEAAEWIQRNIARKNQSSKAKPKRIMAMDAVRYYNR